MRTDIENKVFEHLGLNEHDFENAVQKAMKEFNVSRKMAISHLLLFMCANGDTEDFREAVNYFLMNQRGDAL